MGSSRVSLKRSLLLAAFASLSVFSTTAAAQNTNTNNPSTNSGNNNNNPPATSSPANTNTPAPASSSPASSTPTGPATSRITGGTADTSVRDIPNITSPGSGGGPATLPTLSRTLDAIPTYPPPGVPPTNQAPFMQHSTMPEGTVFIAVGAILGAFGLTVLVWRAVIACLLHRDVERAALAQHAANDKAAGSFPTPPAPFYKSYNESGSNPNLLAGGMGAGAAGLGPAGSSASLAGRGVRRTHRGPTPSATPSQSNLFFSPTATSGLGGGGGSVSNRDSRFLPSGFYAAGAGSPNPPRHEHSISLSNLRPDSRGHARAVSGMTPPESPAMHPTRQGSNLGHTSGPGGIQRNVSTTSLNLNTPPVGRAPSAYLDDMLDDPTGHPMPSPSPVARTGSYYGPGTPSPGPHQPLNPHNHSPQSRTFSSSPHGGRF
ncbi:hypothetical protein RB594_002522 [Gaeumannomyces avenae]